jgi:molybdopterin synthase sulfur carrier subunit
MQITIKFIGAFRGITGKNEMPSIFEGSTTLKEVVRKIIKESPQLERVLIDPELEDPRPNTLILVNGKEINVLNGLETVLKEGDEIVFVPIIHGG